MARKKDKDKKKPEETKGAYGWGEEEKTEELAAEGLKRTDMDEGRVELVDRDLSTPVIETYDKDTGEIEGAVLLKDGNREGLLAQVKIIEEVSVEQDHYASLESIGFNGKLNVENPSSKDRLWDIDIKLKNIESTNLKSDEISIRELGVDEDDNVDSREFEITGEAKNLLLIKEFINTLPNADDILNISDIETELLKIRDKTSEDVKITKKETYSEDEEEEEEEDEDYDAGAEEYSLESYGISIDKENTVTFAIAMRSLFEKPLANVKVTKTILNEFDKPRIVDTTIGKADQEGDTIVWTIDRLEPETTALLKFTCTITVNDIDARKTGPIEVEYQAASSFAGGMEIDQFDAYTRNRFYVEKVERDEEPGVWDCKLVFANTSEFILGLFNADVYATDDASTKFVDIDPEEVPRLPAGAEWHSTKWQYESDDFPQFRKKIEFRVVPDFQTIVNGAISIGEVELAIASITGSVVYSLKEEIPEREEEAEEVEEAPLIIVPTFKEQNVWASLKMANNGSAPLNEVSIVQQFFTDEFQPPNSDEIKLIWNGGEVELDSSAVSTGGNELRIELTDLKDSSTGMLDPEGEIEFQYPIHSINPAVESRFESEIVYVANTFPQSEELEFRPVVPIIEAVHIRRKFRVGKEVVPISSLGDYQIILYVENISESPLENFVLLDKVPDNFEYGDYSVEPEITDEVGSDTLKWELDPLEEGDKLEITYEIHGKGDYKPSDAQVAY